MPALEIDDKKVTLEETLDQLTLPTAPEDGEYTEILAGQAMQVNDTTGRFELGADDSAGPLWIAVNTVRAGRTVTGIRRGVMYLGDALDGLDFNDPIYVDADGNLADSGTRLAGFVIPAFGNGPTPDRLFKVEPQPLIVEVEVGGGD